MWFQYQEPLLFNSGFLIFKKYAYYKEYRGIFFYVTMSEYMIEYIRDKYGWL